MVCSLVRCRTGDGVGRAFSRECVALNSALLEGTDIAVFRGEHCLFSGLNLALGSGQVLQVSGDNGSGKTTLLRGLCTFVPLEQGEIRWRGSTLPRDRDRYFSELTYLGHHEGLKGDLSVQENLRASASLSASDLTAIPAAIERVGLQAQAGLPCRSLSAGQRRRVSLARLLISDTPLWILDEPLTSLDRHGKSLVESLLVEHVAGGGLVVYTTHQPLSLQQCDVQILNMSDW